MDEKERPKIGRPTLSDTGESMTPRQIRMTDAEWEKCKALGGATWVRSRIKLAKLPKPKKPPDCYVYTHADKAGRVFYVGCGKGNRPGSFGARSEAHRAHVAALGGKQNVVVTKRVVKPMYARREESREIALALFRGCQLVQNTDTFAVRTNLKRLRDAEKVAASAAATTPA